MDLSVRSILTNADNVARARWYLRKADAIGRRVRVDGRPHVRNSGRMVIGERVRLTSVVATIELVSEPGGELVIEDNVFINAGTSIGASLRIRIGEGTQIGPHCILIDNAYHHVEPEKRLTRPQSVPIDIQPNVWLGPRVIVFPGVTIGRDACVGAGAVVTRDVPARTLAAGVPATIVREL